MMLTVYIGSGITRVLENRKDASARGRLPTDRLGTWTVQRSHGNRKLFCVQIAHDRASALKNSELLEDEAQAGLHFRIRIQNYFSTRPIS